MKQCSYNDFKKSLLNEHYIYFKVLAYVFAAPLAFILNRLRIRPNQVTIFAILLVVPAMYLNITGHYITAIGIFHLFFLCDTTDGVVARGADLKSPLGAYLDDMAHYLFHTPFLLSLSFHLFKSNMAFFAIVVMLFAVIDMLYRAELDLVDKLRLRAGEASVADLHGNHSGILIKIKSIVLGSFNFPNALVWMTLTCWNLKLMEAYFVYATTMSIMYLFYTFIKRVRFGLMP